MSRSQQTCRPTTTMSTLPLTSGDTPLSYCRHSVAGLSTQMLKVLTAARTMRAGLPVFTCGLLSHASALALLLQHAQVGLPCLSSCTWPLQCMLAESQHFTMAADPGFQALLKAFGMHCAG